MTPDEIRNAEVYIAGHRENEICLTCNRVVVKNKDGSWGHILKRLNENHEPNPYAQYAKKEKIKALEEELARLKQAL